MIRWVFSSFGGFLYAVFSRTCLQEYWESVPSDCVCMVCVRAYYNWRAIFLCMLTNTSAKMSVASKVAYEYGVRWFRLLDCVWLCAAHFPSFSIRPCMIRGRIWHLRSAAGANRQQHTPHTNAPVCLLRAVRRTFKYCLVIFRDSSWAKERRLFVIWSRLARASAHVLPSMAGSMKTAYSSNSSLLIHCFFARSIHLIRRLPYRWPIAFHIIRNRRICALLGLYIHMCRNRIYGILGELSEID